MMSIRKTTGNTPSRQLRDFDFPIENIPDHVITTMGINFTDLSEIEYISGGSSAIVYSGVREANVVAVKMLRSKLKNKKVAVEDLYLEYQILRKVNHPNIVRIFGAGEEPRKFIVMEQLEGGTLDSLFMQTDNKSPTSEKLPSINNGIPFLVALNIAMELANALQYLHHQVHSSAIIIHRDLKPQNIGFDSNGTLKLFDFGLAACVKRTQLATDAYEMTGYTGTLAYMAPEVALRLPYNEKVDVYSFSIILWQMLSGQMPYQGLTREEHLQQVARDGQRPSLLTIKSKYPSGIVHLLERCWHADYSQRPSFLTIYNELKAFKDGGFSSPSSPRFSSHPVPVITINSGVLPLAKYFRRTNTIIIGPDDMSDSDRRKAVGLAHKSKPSKRKRRFLRLLCI